jgi:hypothetical protein
MPKSLIYRATALDTPLRQEKSAWQRYFYDFNSLFDTIAAGMHN